MLLLLKVLNWAAAAGISNWDAYAPAAVPALLQPAPTHMLSAMREAGRSIRFQASGSSAVLLAVLSVLLLY